MTYLLKRNGHYYYNRRVPDVFRDLAPRDTVRVSLNTDSKHQARRKAILFNDEVEAYWQAWLMTTGCMISPVLQKQY